MNKTILYQLLALLLLFGITSTSNAQVTIGGATRPQSGTVLDLNPAQGDPLKPGNIGGLLLPNVKITDLDKIPMDFSDASVRGLDKLAALAGTVVYNTHLGTGVGLYLWDGDRWKQAGTGGLVSNGCESTLINKDGETRTCAITDPSCDILGEYKFEIVSGKNFIDLEILDSGAGNFKITFQATDQGDKRTAILMVVSPCGASGLFIYTQDGDLGGCGTTTVPPIKSSTNLTDICSGGSLNLYLDNPNASGVYIWTLNGEVVGNGTSLTAVKPGRYIVYGDKIGCPGSKEEIVLSAGGGTAPSAVEIKTVANSGVACDANGTVRTMTAIPSSGNVVWYNNGIRIGSIMGNGTDVLLGKGVWIAVVEDGTCSSLPSKPITIREDLSGGTIPMPEIKINGSTTTYSLCKGGSMLLEVNNPSAGVTYSWFIDNIEVGKGTSIYQRVPADDNVVIRLRATGTGCAKEALKVESISATQAPSAPALLTNNQQVLCGGTALLEAQGGGSGITAYRWYRNGNFLLETATNTHTISQVGSYSVSAVLGTCASLRSGETPIRLSDYAKVRWNIKHDQVTYGDTKTFTVDMDFPDNPKYVWSVTGTAPGTAPIIQTGNEGNGSPAASIFFPTIDPSVEVKCIVTNACGDAIGSPIAMNVEVQSGCTDADIFSQSALNIPLYTTAPGNKATMSVTGQGTPALNYEWFEGKIGVGTPASKQSGTNPAYEFTAGSKGTFYYYCVVSIVGGSCNSATSKQFTITVTEDPATIPAGSGKFTGHKSFDIAFSNNLLNGCGPLSTRTKTDFTDTAEQDPLLGSSPSTLSGYQVYTFIPEGEVSNVHFEFTNTKGKVVKTFIPKGDFSGNVTTACKFLVVYEDGLNETVKGFARDQALGASLFVVYNNKKDQLGAINKQQIDVDVSDCGGCGAYTDKAEWLTFMCHNLGADQSLNPFEWDNSKGNADGSDIKGDLYQWGRQADGHEKRNSGISAGVASGAALDATGQITTGNAKYGKFITNSTTPYDWRSPQLLTNWGNGSQDENVAKADNDPCPAGWKVPTQKQWGSIFRGGTTSGAPATATSNTWTWDGKGGFMVGDNLYLPAAGRRNYNNASFDSVGSNGFYWSSTVNGTNSYYLYFSSGGVYPASNNVRAYGLSVRCVAE